MSGANVIIDDTQVIEALNALLKAGSDFKPLLGDIGEYLDQSTRRRFDDQVAPDGTPWEYLSVLSHLLTKEKNPDKILTESGRLRESMHYDISGNELTFGTNVVYAAVHQFGAVKGAFGQTSRGTPIPWGDIPAREFLGLSADDEQEISEILKDYLESEIE